MVGCQLVCRMSMLSKNSAAIVYISKGKQRQRKDFENGSC